MTAEYKFAAKDARQALKDEDIVAYEAAKKLELEARATPEPVEPRYMASDVTPEAIVRLLAEQGGRIGIVSDEGGRYSARWRGGTPTTCRTSVAAPVRWTD